MINKLHLSSFKCFKEQDFSLSSINVFTGYNGRGKSSVLQALLMLAQSINKHDNLQTLEVNGCFVHLDLFDDVLCRQSSAKRLGIEIVGKDSDNSHHLKLQFSRKTSTTGNLVALSYNGKNFFEKAADLSGSAPESKQRGYLFNYPSISNSIFKDFSYLSANRIGPTLFEEKRDVDSINPLGTDGQFRLNLLRGNDVLKGEISRAISYIMDGGDVVLRGEDEDSPVLSFGFKNISGEEGTFKAINCGFGYSYILSVLLLAHNSIGGCLFLENPEAHLHPCAQSRLMKLLCEKCHVNGTQLFVETHSEHILNAVRLLAVSPESSISEEDVSIYFFNKDFSVNKLTLESNGQISPWPIGFFDQQEEDLSEILKLGLFKR